MTSRVDKADLAPAGLHDTGGRLVYAIGDIHGRADLLSAMLVRIAEDAASRRAAFDVVPLVVFLGDYIDRGRQSREVIEQVLAFRADPAFEVRCLLGNHEDAMIDYLERRTGGAGWAKRGGRATMESYGVKVPLDPTDRPAWSATRAALAQAVPAAHLDFMRGLELAIARGDILFVNAGVRPGVALDAQDRTDLLWIRSEFLDHDAAFGKLIVHGHTPIGRAHMGPHRIGLDTGAYASGLLSAARFDGSSPALIEVRAGRA